jgi:hypothetical protein
MPRETRLCASQALDLPMMLASDTLASSTRLQHLKTNFDLQRHNVLLLPLL